MKRKKKETRPGNSPVAVRFTPEQILEIEEVAKDFQMSKQDVIRLSVAAGLKAMRKIGLVGIQEFIASEIRNPKKLAMVAEETEKYGTSSSLETGDPLVDQEVKDSLDQAVGEIDKAASEGWENSSKDQ